MTSQRSHVSRFRIAMAASALVAACAAPARQDELYDPDVVQEIALELAPADLQKLEDSATSAAGFVYVPATFRWNDVTLEDVGVRFKGNSSRTPAGRTKRSYLIKFDELVEGQDFVGLKRLGLDNAIQFGSLFSERILDEILRAEGVPASRANYARLTINGVYQGVYVNVERIDKRFLARHFDDNDGNLYKCDEGGPGGRLDYLGDDPAAYARGDGAPTFQAETNEDTADGRDLIALAATLDRGTIAEVTAAVELDGFLKLLPILMFGGAFDQYTGFQAHNYYLYRDPASAKWTYLAHDLDVGFADRAFGTIPVIDGWDAATPRPVSPLPLVDRVLDDPALRARYRAHAIDYLDRYFEPARLGARLDALYAQIEDDLAADPYPAARITNPDVVGYPAIVADLKQFMRRRYDTARAQLLGAP